MPTYGRARAPTPRAHATAHPRMHALTPAQIDSHTRGSYVIDPAARYVPGAHLTEHDWPLPSGTDGSQFGARRGSLGAYE